MGLARSGCVIVNPASVDKHNILASIEKLSEDEVRKGLLTGQYGQVGSEYYSLVDGWLRSKADARKESREAMSLSISRKALFNSRIATIIAAIAIIIAASDKLISLLRWIIKQF